MEPHTPRCPLVDDLPPEIIIRIFDDCFPFAIDNIGLVCKKWRNFIQHLIDRHAANKSKWGTLRIAVLEPHGQWRPKTALEPIEVLEELIDHPLRGWYVVNCTIADEEFNYDLDSRAPDVQECFRRFLEESGKGERKRSAILRLADEAYSMPQDVPDRIINHPEILDGVLESSDEYGPMSIILPFLPNVKRLNLAVESRREPLRAMSMLIDEVDVPSTWTLAEGDPTMSWDCSQPTEVPQRCDLQMPSQTLESPVVGYSQSMRSSRGTAKLRIQPIFPRLEALELDRNSSTNDSSLKLSTPSILLDNHPNLKQMTSSRLEDCFQWGLHQLNAVYSVRNMRFKRCKVYRDMDWTMLIDYVTSLEEFDCEWDDTVLENPADFIAPVQILQSSARRTLQRLRLVIREPTERGVRGDWVFRNSMFDVSSFSALHSVTLDARCLQLRLLWRQDDGNETTFYPLADKLPSSLEDLTVYFQNMSPRRLEIAATEGVFNDFTYDCRKHLTKLAYIRVFHREEVARCMHRMYQDIRNSCNLRLEIYNEYLGP